MVVLRNIDILGKEEVKSIFWKYMKKWKIEEMFICSKSEFDYDGGRCKGENNWWDASYDKRNTLSELSTDKTTRIRYFIIGLHHTRVCKYCKKRCKFSVI